MNRCAWLLLLPIAACSGPAPIRSAGPAPARPACRVGPDGARPADLRPTDPRPADPRQADRGLGGTGTTAIERPGVLNLEMRTADRGIGGTGIVGVVTGFGSLCVAGERVALPDTVPVAVDDRPSTLDALRAGQVTAVRASSASGALSADQIDILHVVIGPVGAVTPETMRVAGQLVLRSRATGSAVGAGPGAWVAVSGLKEPSGEVVATRIDPATPGRVLVRGELARVFGATLIGRLGVILPAGEAPPAGWPVLVSGQLKGGILVADEARIDAVANSPPDYFGAATDRYVVEGYVTPVPGGILVDHTFVAGTDLGIAGIGGRRIVAFQRDADGRLRLSSHDLGTPAAPRPNNLFAPLPGMSLSPGALGGADEDQSSHSAPHRK